MPSALQALAAKIEAARKAALVFHPGLRELTADEVELIGHAIAGGGYVRTDSGMADYLRGEGGLPVYWSTYLGAEQVGRPDLQEAADRQRAAREAFQARCLSGDLKALAMRVAVALTVASAQREAA